MRQMLLLPERQKREKRKISIFCRIYEECFY